MQNKPKAELTAALMLLDTRSMSFDMREIDNRRFMFSPQTGELILGRQYRGGQLYKSHAEEHFDSCLLYTSKSKSYYYDAAAIAEPIAPTTAARYRGGRSAGHKYDGEVPGQGKVCLLYTSRHVSAALPDR